MTIQGLIVDGFLSVLKVLDAIASSQSKCCKETSNKLKALDEKVTKQGLTLDRVESKLDQILENLIPGPTVSATFTFFGTIGNPMTVKDTQTISFVIKPVDAKGNPSNIDATKTTLSASDPSLATVVVNPDGLSGTVTLLGPLGTFTLSGSLADDPTDGSDGGTIQVTSDSITIVGGDTATATIALTAV